MPPYRDLVIFYLKTFSDPEFRISLTQRRFIKRGFMKVQMKYYNSPSIKIPKLGIGTWQIEGYNCTEIVAKGLSAGYRLVDTAQIYNNEEFVGEGIEKSGVDRENIFLVSKVWRDNLSREDVVSSTRESLDKLRTDYVDLMLIHWPNDAIALDETLAGMEEILNEGMAQNFGVSNFPLEWLERTQEITPDFVCNQVEYHPFISQDVVLNWLKKHDKFMMAYSPLARGGVFKNEVIQKIANKHAATEAQISLAWLLEQDHVVAIPKTATEDHLLRNLESLEIQLDAEDIESINGLKSLNKRLIKPEFSPKWDVSI